MLSGWRIEPTPTTLYYPVLSRVSRNNVIIQRNNGIYLNERQRLRGKRMLVYMVDKGHT